MFRTASAGSESSSSASERASASGSSATAVARPTSTASSGGISTPEEVLAGLRLADQSGEKPRAPVAGDETHVDEPLAEDPALAHHSHVTREREVTARPDGRAADGRDSRLGRPPQLADDVLDRPEVARVLLLGERGPVGHLGDVRAGTEAVAGTRQYQDVDRVVVRRPSDGVVEVLQRLSPERVVRLGPVDGDGGDAVLGLVAYVLVHGRMGS